MFIIRSINSNDICTFTSTKSDTTVPISLEWAKPHQEEDTTRPNTEPVAGPSRIRKPPSWLKDSVVWEQGSCGFLSRIFSLIFTFGLTLLFCNNLLLEGAGGKKHISIYCNVWKARAMKYFGSLSSLEFSFFLTLVLLLILLFLELALARRVLCWVELICLYHRTSVSKSVSKYWYYW